MRNMIIVCVLAWVLLAPLTAAQEPEKYGECEFDPTFAAIQTEFEKVTDWQTLEAFNAALDSSMAFCMGLYWSGDGTQESTVFQFVIPAGTYRHVVTTEGFIITEFEWLNSECEDMRYSFTGANVFEGGAINGSEVVYRYDKDCEVLMTVHNVRMPWIVEFRPVQ